MRSYILMAAGVWRLVHRLLNAYVIEVVESSHEEMNKRKNNLAFAAAPGNIATQMHKALQADVEDSCDCIERAMGYVFCVVNSSV
jgi:hypothetical protein